jgi:hypothetical protein
MSQVIVPLLQSSPLLGVLEFVVGHAVAGLLMVSYVRTIASEPGYVPIEFYLEHVRLLCVCLHVDTLCRCPQLKLVPSWLLLLLHVVGERCGVRHSLPGS